MNVTLRQLRAFVAGANSTSFSEAAGRVHITQPGYSLLIRQLEEQLGLKLFDRTTRRLALTPAGREFALRIGSVLTDLDGAFEDVRDLRLARRGRVTVAILPSAASSLVPKVVQTIGRSHPGVTVTVLERLAAPLIQSVMAGEADIGFGIELDANDEMRFEPLLKDKLVGVFASGNPLARNRQLRWSDLQHAPYIRFGDMSSLHHHAEHAARRANVRLNVVSEVLYMTTAVSLAQGGVGFTVLPELALDSLNLRGLKTRPIVDPQAVRTLGIIRRERRTLSPAAAAAVAAFNTVCRSPPAGSQPIRKSS